jgi:hypothetical protein
MIRGETGAGQLALPKTTQGLDQGLVSDPKLLGFELNLAHQAAFG